MLMRARGDQDVDLAAWQSAAAGPPRGSMRPGGRSPRDAALDLRRDYEEIVRECCEHYGFDHASIRVEPVSLGSHGGREVYVVLLAVVHEDAARALQLTYGAPVFERRIAELVGSRWISDYTRFAGVWTHWPPNLRVPEDIKAMVRAANKGGAAGRATAGGGANHG